MMNFKVVGVIKNQVWLDEENFVWEKKIRIEPLGIIRKMEIPKEDKPYIEVIYDNKQSQVIAIDFKLPPNETIASYVKKIKTMIKDVINEEDIDVGMIL